MRVVGVSQGEALTAGARRETVGRRLGAMWSAHEGFPDKIVSIDPLINRGETPEQLLGLGRGRTAWATAFAAA